VIVGATDVYPGIGKEDLDAPVVPLPGGAAERCEPTLIPPVGIDPRLREADVDTAVLAVVRSDVQGGVR
jgi:hypothetical protein